MIAEGMFTAFSFIAGGSPRLEDPGVDTSGNPVRRRRRHAKSKSGCIPCKKRRVRCDENRPGCSNCASKSLQCQYHSDLPQCPSQVTMHVKGANAASAKEADQREGLISPARSINSHSDDIAQWCVQSILVNPAIDLDKMRLLHHFEISTCDTLLFGSDLWKFKVMPLALKNGYLMHGILLMASTHLRYLNPESKLYAEAESYHLALALGGLRGALSGTMSDANADTVIACSLILLHHAWSVPYSPEKSSELLTPVDIGADNMLAFSAGLKSVLQSVWHVREGSIFREIIRSITVNTFKIWAATESFPCEIEMILQRQPGLALPNDDGDEACVGLGCVSMDAIDRLTPVMRAAHFMTQGNNINHLVTDISRYLLMWPGKCTDEFQKDVKENDKQALLILLCFYLCTLCLVSNDLWWVRDRSRYMCHAISERLEKDTDWCGERAAWMCKHFRFERRPA